MQEANLDCTKCGASIRDPDENCPKCHAVLVQESDIESLKRSKEEWSQVLAGDSPHIPSLPAWISGKSELVERRQGVADYFATLSGHLKAIESEEAAIAEVRGSLA